MSYVKILPLNEMPYHQQDDQGWCGAASAQMLLHNLDLRDPSVVDPSLWSQRDLRSEIENRSIERESQVVWLAQPDGLVTTINLYAPNAGPNFQLVLSNNADIAARRIIWHIETKDRGAIALVYGMMHWLVVRGFATDRKPTGPGDNYTIISLYVSDPYPPVPTPKLAGMPPPHTDFGDKCGVGPTRGTDVCVVPYDSWKNVKGYKVTGVPSISSSVWCTKYLSICAPLAGNASNESGARAPQCPVQPVHERAKPVSRAGEEQLGGDDPIEPVSAARDALANLKDVLPGRWNNIVENGVADPPYEVNRLDIAFSQYYIVLFRVGGNIRVAAAVDGETGALLCTRATPSPEDDVIHLITLQEAADIVANTQVPDENHGIFFRAQDIEGDAPLVWKPCLESFSHFYPFYRFTIKTFNRTFTLYVRAYDGMVFPALHDNVAGA